MCPHCGHPKSNVTETRRVTDGSVWRRRRCRACKKSFISQEVADKETRFPDEVTDAMLARLRDRPERRRKTAPPLLPDQHGATSGFKGWSQPA